MSDLGLQLFEATAGIQLQSVPYRGASQAITDILAAHLDGLFGDVPTVMAQVRAGSLKALATTSKARSDILPDVPTFVEEGFPGVVGDNWDGVLAPAGTPEPVIAKFNAAMVAALNDPGLRARLHESGTTPAPSSPGEFGDYLRAGDFALGDRDQGKRAEGRIGLANRRSGRLSSVKGGYARFAVLLQLSARIGATRRPVRRR